MVDSRQKFKCKICEKEFKSISGLHNHLSRIHKSTQKEYYLTYYPRKNKLTGSPLPFKNWESYFNSDFTFRPQMIKWCSQAPKEEVKSYIFNLLKNRMKSKKLELAPNSIELETSKLPPMDTYREVFGSYANVCKELGKEALYGQGAPPGFFKQEPTKGLPIFVDTREQKPYSYINSETLKLDFGDYTLGGDSYNYIYIDRKSEEDYKGTLSAGNIDRFKRELDRARQFGAFLFILVESDLSRIWRNNQFSSHKHKLGFIYHNMRVVTHDYHDVCQFVFAGTRSEAYRLTPLLLEHGQKVKKSDVQYFLNKDMEDYDLGDRITT